MQKSTNNLREVRKSAGYTLDRLAKESAVPRSTIGAFEKGSRPLGKDHREKIEKILGVEICRISTDQPENNRPYLAELNESAGGPWGSMPTDQIKALLRQCVGEEDWGAVHLISKKLLDRKLETINNNLQRYDLGADPILKVAEGE